VYPSKKRLIQLLLLGIVALAACGGPGLYAYEQPAVDDAQGVVVLSSVACVFCLLAILISIRQLIRPQPLFTLSDAGFHIRKMTLVRWREIVGMYIVGEGSAKSWASRRSLILRVANPRAVISRQPRRWQWALRLGNYMFGSPVAISEQQLPVSLESVEETIAPYLKRAHGDDRGDEDLPDIETEEAQD